MTDVEAPDLALVALRVTRALPVEIGSVTTYDYLTTGGARGSTTDRNAIPLGATVQRRTTV